MIITQKAFFFLPFIVLSLPIHAQEANSYTITAHIEGVPDGTEYFLRKNKEGGGTDTVARGAVVSNRLHITGAVREPELHFLFLKDQKEYFPLLLENDKFSIRGAFTEWPKIKVDGPAHNKEYQEMKAVLNVDLDKAKELKDEIAKYSMNLSDTARLRKLYKERDSVLNHYYEVLLPTVITKYPNNVYSAFLIHKQLKTNASEKLKFFKKLSSIVQQSKYGRELLQETQILVKSEVAGVTNSAPDFSLPALQTGELVSLREFASSNKYTYVDFWASWCKPCRAQFPELKEIYKEYRNKGFNVLGVSIDKDKAAWKKAVKEEGLVWINVSDLKGSKSEVSILYALSYIPRSVLIDKNGKIIARNIHGEKLKGKLKELLP
ncbi:TlpA disulfide reductase family protein [Chitinophaga sp. XS-30]|uniref:TlpA disulfide reductase family protein n=1 Tax=Chitinophaga sp. XS-30 TaxID=2604421 RepID=UPI0011DD7273|nr:TlpA disulfide reductase family protein [Chitinophaga sp. XS-30]QEH39452.1 AhpC/TSA family protein [Chitinophaga sp. XS-30]